MFMQRESEWRECYEKEISFGPCPESLPAVHWQDAAEAATVQKDLLRGPEMEV